MKKTLAVIGRGTVGCSAVALFLSKTDFTVNWYYDPNIEPTPVGEGTTLGIPSTWFETNLISTAVDMIDLNSTNKIGIRKRNWGNQGTDFLHAFPVGSVGLHFSGVTLQQLTFQRLCEHPNLNAIERNVGPNDLDEDYVLVCTGSPSEYGDSFHEVNDIPVNAALVSQCPWDHARFDYTLTYAMPHGWCFGIPLRNRCSIGYVHNSNFIDRDQANQEVSELLNELNLTPQTQNYFNFRNYYKKVNFTDRVAYCGNASFFLEPIEATSLDSSIHIIRRCIDGWINGKYTAEQNNAWYLDHFKNIHLMIAMHYAAGSIYNNDFWNHASAVSKKRLEQGCQEDALFMNNLIKINKYKSLLRSNEHSPVTVDLHPAGTWNWSNSYIQNAEGLGLQSYLNELDSKYTLNKTQYDWDPSVWETVID